MRWIEQDFILLTLSTALIAKLQAVPDTLSDGEGARGEKRTQNSLNYASFHLLKLDTLN